MQQKAPHKAGLRGCSRFGSVAFDRLAIDGAVLQHDHVFLAVGLDLAQLHQQIVQSLANHSSVIRLL